MKKNNFIPTNAGLAVILLIAAAFVLKSAVHAKAPPSPKISVPYRSIRPEFVDVKPAPRVYDLDKLKVHEASLNGADSAKINSAEIIEAKAWRDADPNVKKEMAAEFDANIAKSKKALEADPNDAAARRILLVSERRKKIEMENFEGNYLSKNVGTEEPGTPTAH